MHHLPLNKIEEMAKVVVGADLGVKSGTRIKGKKAVVVEELGEGPRFVCRHSDRGQIAGRPARVAHEHDQVAPLHPLLGNSEVARWVEGNIFLRIGGGSTVGRNIGAESGKVAGMPRPFPVVDIASIFADGPRRGIDQTHITKNGAVDGRARRRDAL